MCNQTFLIVKKLHRTNEKMYNVIKQCRNEKYKMFKKLYATAMYDIENKK